MMRKETLQRKKYTRRTLKKQSKIHLHGSLLQIVLTSLTHFVCQLDIVQWIIWGQTDPWDLSLYIFDLLERIKMFPVLIQ